eukprot:5753955-Prymnesium_polylepis.1
MCVSDRRAIEGGPRDDRSGAADRPLTWRAGPVTLLHARMYTVYLNAPRWKARRSEMFWLLEVHTASQISQIVRARTRSCGSCWIVHRPTERYRPVEG